MPLSEVFAFFDKVWKQTTYFSSFQVVLKRLLFASVNFYLGKPRKTLQEIPLKIFEANCNTPHALLHKLSVNTTHNFCVLIRFYYLFTRTKTIFSKFRTTYRPINCFVVQVLIV